MNYWKHQKSIIILFFPRKSEYKLYLPSNLPQNMKYLKKKHKFNSSKYTNQQEINEKWWNCKTFSNSNYLSKKHFNNMFSSKKTKNCKKYWLLKNIFHLKINEKAKKNTLQNFSKKNMLLATKNPKKHNYETQTKKNYLTGCKIFVISFLKNKSTENHNRSRLILKGTSVYYHKTISFATQKNT